MQRAYLLLIFLCAYLSLSAQTTEFFTDGNFKANPVWLGDTNYFTITPELTLQSNGPAATSQQYLATSNNRCRDTEWNFYLKLDLDITTTNWSKIYLTSDRADLKNNPKGYYVKFDGANNSVDFYRQDSTLHTKLIAGKKGRAGKTSLNVFRIKVICESNGKWHLFSDSTATGNHFIKEGNIVDTTFTTSAYCGIYFAHSSTRRTRFYFDDFTITRASFSLLSVVPLSATELKFIFNKEIDVVSASQTANYFIAPGENGFLTLAPDNGNKSAAIATLLNPLNTYTNYFVSVNNILDKELNPVSFLNSYSFYYRVTAQYGDLVMTELMPDPAPTIELPEAEYVELFNRTTDTLNLKDFSLSDGSYTAIFPLYKLAPGRRLLLCNSTAISYFQNQSPVLGLPNFPSLNNSGDHLVLKNYLGEIVHEVRYSDSWYGDNDKKTGGWSLEMIDTDYPCVGESNWIASINPRGGTPGVMNSVAAHKPDLAPPNLINGFIADPTHIYLTFDEAPDSTTLSPTFFILEPSMSIVNASLIPNNQKILVLSVTNQFVPSQLYSLSISGIRDCSGNIASPVSVTLVKPQQATLGDIVLNEILFNPSPGGYDFVELYNRSDKYVDLKNWHLANTIEGIISNKKVITDQPLILKPHDYIAFTENKSMLLNHYPSGKTENIVEITDLPSYNDDVGSVILLNDSSTVYDRFDYSEDFHFALLDDKEGVSLERIFPNAATNNSQNWHSASSQSGFATPGYKNSQHAESTDGTKIWVEPEILVPDKTGQRDFVMIHYKFDNPGNTANIFILDHEGREILRLAQNELLATEGFYRWDGTNAENKKVRAGAYIVYIELFNLNGEIKKYKEAVVVAPGNFSY